MLVGLVGAIGCGVTALLPLRAHRLWVSPLTWLAVMLTGVVVATVAMELAILTDDFSLLYVARNSATHTPLAYKVATLWGALEGSILLWALVLSGYVCAAAWRVRRRLDEPVVAVALTVMAAVCVFFFALMAGPANPFVTVDVVPDAGGGLNPLLANHPLMVIHPVMLYLGYVGFTVPFAFAIGALVTGDSDDAWLRAVRTSTLVAWGSLGVGIVLGAWWSYEVLGWGGYWAWDPVENASLLPWLTSTAFVHSILTQQRRQMLRVWNITLLLASFALTIFGTFLTRSGVLDSVHEFSESQIGPLFLAFLAVIVIGSVVLVARRAPAFASPGALASLASREGSFLANNLAFTVAAFIVLLGTVFPLVAEAVTDDRLSVGRPYFDRMLAPVGLVLLVLMSVSPSLSWRSTATSRLARRLLSPAAAGVATMLVALAAGAHGAWNVLALGLAGSTVSAAVAVLVRRVRSLGWSGFTGSSGGGMVAHIGVGLIAFGFIASGAYDSQGEFTLAVGESAQIAGHEVRLEGVERFDDGPNEVLRASVSVAGRGLHHPAITRYSTFGQPISTPSVATSLVDDVYVSLISLGPEAGPEAGPIESPAASTLPAEVTLRVLVKPLVVWMWLGGGVFAAGVVLALVRRRQRARTLAPEPAAATQRQVEPPAAVQPAHTVAPSKVAEHVTR